MRKRFLAAILAAAMAAGLLTGCGGDGTNSGTAGTAGNTQSGQADAGEADNPDEMYEVIMQWPAIGDAPAGLEDVEAAINEITASEGISVRLEPVGAFDLANETSLAVSSGEKLDLCLSLFSGVGPLVNNGSVIPLDELLEGYGQDILTVCGERQMTAGIYNGATYGVPIHYVDGNDMGMVCRKDILDKYGITIDRDKYYTYDELEEMFAKIKEGEGKGFYMFAGGFTEAVMYGGQTATDTMGQSLASGALILDGSGSTQIQNVFATEDFADFAKRMYEWNQAGYYSADASTTTEDSGAQVAAGNYLGMFLQDAAGTTANTYTMMTGTEMTYIKTNPAVATSSGYGNVLWSIAATSENPQKAMKFLNMLYVSPELCNLLMYGIEGVSYEVVEQDENGTVVAPIGGDTMAVPYWQQFGIYGDRLSWAVTAPAGTTLNKELIEFSKGITKQSPALGYVFNIDSVSTQYSAVSSVIRQYLPIIQTGSIDPEKELPEFLSALEAAGIDAVIAENQNQLDAWLAE